MFFKKIKRVLNCRTWTRLERLEPTVKHISISSDNTKCYRKSLLLNNGRYFDFHLSKEQNHTSTLPFAYPIENTYAHNVLRNSKVYSKSLASQLSPIEELPIHKIENSLQQSWINMSNSKLLEDFELLSHYASKNVQNINDMQFRGIIEVLTTKCPDFNDEELIHFFKCLELWNISKYNIYYNGLWKAIDEKCLERMSNWDINTIFLINDYFYKLSLCKYTKFPIQSLKIVDKTNMTAANLVQYAFLLKINKKMFIYLHDLEHLFEKNVDKFSVEEMGIIAMAYFKYETHIKNKTLILQFLQKLLANINTVDDITVSAILKALRYNIDLSTVNQYDILLRSLINQIHRCSIQTLTHIAHLQSRTLLKKKELISKILDRYNKEIQFARLKDIERIIFTLYIFNYNPETTQFYSIAAKELMNSRRNLEINRFPNSLVYSVLYMMQVNYYPEEALKYIMTQKYIKMFCKNDITNLDREYLILDYCIEIDHPNYNGPRIRKDLLNYLVKKFGVLKKKERKKKYQKVDQAEKLLIDVSHTCKTVLRNDSVIHIDSLLPHFPKSDIIICYDSNNKKFISPIEKISKMLTGTIKYAPKDGLKWYTLVITAHNNLTRNTFQPTGALAVYLRHLKQIGYIPILIRYDIWQNLPNNNEKENYIKDLLSLP